METTSQFPPIKANLRVRTHLRVGDAEDLDNCIRNLDFEIDQARRACEQNNANKYSWAKKDDCSFDEARKKYHEFCQQYYG